MSEQICPTCGKELKAVRQSPHSLLSAEQFAAQMAGDYFCLCCPGKRGNTGYKYWWRKEVTEGVQEAEGKP